MDVRELSSWSEFRTAVDALLSERKVASKTGTHHSDILFRGQSNSAWPLATTLERWPGAGLRLRQYHQTLTAIQDEIESRLRRTWDVPSYPDFERLLADGRKYWELIAAGDLYDFMIYVRHHGFPSPLLDWTRSPYIAAYFAFAGATSAESVAIFAYQEYTGAGKGGWAAAPRIVGLGPYVRTHPRHHLQQAEYTVAISDEGHDTAYCEHERAFDESNRETQDLLWKFVLPASERTTVLRYLHLHNLTAYSLFGSEEKLMESLAIRELTLRE